MPLRRAGKIINALHAAELLHQQGAAQSLGGRAGLEPATWLVAAKARGLPPPILVVEDGEIVGVRLQVASDGEADAARLRRAKDRIGLSARELARRLGLNDRTLRRMLDGSRPPLADDPVWERLAKLAR